MMQKIISIFLLCMSIQMSQAGENKSFYTLHLGTFPLVEQQQGLMVYKNIKEKGYLAYHQVEEVLGKKELTVYVGLFSEKTQAQKLGEKLQLPYTVRKTKLFVDYYKQFKVITTPSAVWYDTGSSLRELYPFNGIHSNDLLDQTYALISPIGKDIVFYEDGKIIKVDVKTGKSQILVKEGLFNSRPAWSYDGRYIAYLDNTEWETLTSLCLIEAEKNHCLIKNDEHTQKAVKSFRWHPGKNHIFFVEGHAYGTVSVGGNLYVTNTDGKRKDVVIGDVNKAEEISADFSIHEGGLLTYQVVQFDKNYTKSLSTVTHKIRIDNYLMNQ